MIAMMSARMAALERALRLAFELRAAIETPNDGIKYKSLLVPTAAVQAFDEAMKEFAQ